MWLSVTIFYVNSSIYSLFSDLYVCAPFSPSTIVGRKTRKLFQQNLIIAINWNKSLLMASFSTLALKECILLHWFANPLEISRKNRPTRLKVHSFLETCLLFPSHAMLINFSIYFASWYFLIDIHGNHIQASIRIHRKYMALVTSHTLAYFMTVCSWCTAYNAQRWSMFIAELFERRINFALVLFIIPLLWIFLFHLVQCICVSVHLSRQTNSTSNWKIYIAAFMNNFAEHPELVQLSAWRKLCRSNRSRVNKTKFEREKWKFTCAKNLFFSIV